MRMVDRFATRLVVAALLVSAVPLSILGFYAYGRIAGSLEQSAVAMAVDRVSQAGRSIRSMQTRTERDVRFFLARLTMLRASEEEAAPAGRQPFDAAQAGAHEVGAAVERQEAGAFSGPAAGRTPQTGAGRPEEALVPGEGGRSPRERRLTLASFIQARPMYRGVLYLDALAVEVLRVDADEPGSSVSQVTEAEREDFARTMAAAPDRVTVSPTFLEQRSAEEGTPPRMLLRYGAPIVNAQGKVEGAVLVTVAVDELLRQAREALSGDDCLSFIADERGHYLHHTLAETVWNTPMNPETANVLQRDFPAATEDVAETPVVKDLSDGRLMVVELVRSGPSASFRSRSDGGSLLRPSTTGAREVGGRAEPAEARGGFSLAGASTPKETESPEVLGWIVGQVYRRDVIFRPVVAFRWTFLGLLAVTMVIAGLVAAGLAHHLTGPVRELQAGTRLVGFGELGYRIPVRSRDEFGELAASFNTMSQQLAKHLKHIEEVTAARARTESELQTAREIQQALLPRKLPPFPGPPPGPAALREPASPMRAGEAGGGLWESLEVFGSNIPAYEVGGDFYDCQPVGGDALLLALGDVSGKGVPAALLMTMTSTLLRTFALESRSPSDILVRTNRALLVRKDLRTFVTVFLALYHVRDRRLLFANAGHPGPFLVTQAGVVTRLRGADLPLGVEEAFQPEDVAIQLGGGDKLFLYSDGLTEARDVAGTPFGTPRLVELLRNSAAPSAKELCEEVIAAVMKHEAGVPQFDDLTVLVLKLKP